MAIAVVLPRALYPYSRGSSTLTLEDPCSTVADALNAIGSRWPGVLDRVMTDRAPCAST